ncbi:glycosyltransferase family 2 protein [Vibrio fluvialis]|nr:glycosyltransferase family 2 protein [Vibrio fluvialis]
MNDNIDIVSVVIPTYGRSDYLSRTIDSVLKQSYRFIEVIVVDDNGLGSHNGNATSEVMRKYEHFENVKYIQHQNNINGSAARNTGVRNSIGSLIAFLDDDDVFDEYKIEKQVHALYDKGYDGVYCLNKKFSYGNLVQETTYSKSGNCQFDVLRMTSDIHTSSLLLRKIDILDIGGFDESFSRHQDFEFLIRYFEKFSIFCIPECLVSVNVESTINRPDINKLLLVKKHFFSSLDYIIGKYNDDDIKQINKAHYFELFRVALKGFRLKSIYYLIKARPTYQDLSVFLLPSFKRNFRRLFR